MIKPFEVYNIRDDKEGRTVFFKFVFVNQQNKKIVLDTVIHIGYNEDPDIAVYNYTKGLNA